MRVAVVGGGRAASALIAALQESEQTLDWTWARGEESPTLESMPPAEVILIAVTDASIEAVAQQLALRSASRGEVWLHLSGALPGTLCRVTVDRPMAAGCLHPLQALIGGARAAQLLKGAMAAIDGETRACEVAHELAKSLGMRPQNLASRSKPLYHAAAVTVAGQAVALLAQAVSMLECVGLSEEEARHALLPLMQGALSHAERKSTAEALTGPIARGDVAVIRRHLEAIAEQTPELLATYKCLAKTGLDLRREALDATVVEELIELLR